MSEDQKTSVFRPEEEAEDCSQDVCEDTVHPEFP